MMEDTTTYTTLLERAEIFASNCHKDTNHLYDGQPYTIHLRMVVKAADKFIDLIPKSKRESVLSACWLHDVEEDCRITYNDLSLHFGYYIAEIVHAVTNEKGKTRKERANDKYYDGIKNTEYAAFVKICDRIANVEYSKLKESSMFEKYKIENENFKQQLYTPELKIMWDQLDNIFNS